MRMYIYVYIHACVCTYTYVYVCVRARVCNVCTLHLLIRSTQFLLTFLLSYVRVTNGQVKYSVSASIYNIRTLYHAFEEDRALHTCVTSQGNFYSLAASRYSYLTATCYFVRCCLQERSSDIPCYSIALLIANLWKFEPKLYNIGWQATFHSS